MLEFSDRAQVLYGVNRREGRSDGTLTEWSKDVDALVDVFPLPSFL